MNKSVIDAFETLLGLIEVSLESTNNYQIVRENENIFNIYTDTFEINLNIFSIESPKEEIYRFNSCRVWMFYISKKEKSNEELLFTISLKQTTGDTYFQFVPDAAANVDSIQVENKDSILHIGTEGELALVVRAKNNDYFPNRFLIDPDNLYQNNLNFIECTDYGFIAKIPYLNIGEKFYFHFIVADDSIRFYDAKTREVDISTWYAVDYPKSYLENLFDKRKNSA